MHHGAGTQRGDEGLRTCVSRSTAPQWLLISIPELAAEAEALPLSQYCR